MKRWLKLIGIFIAFTGGIFIVGFVIASYIIMPIYVRASREVEVPDICGLEFENARQILNERNIPPEIDIERYSDGIPSGIVISQRPAPGRIVKQGSKVFLTVSKGVERLRIPYLIGLDINQANNILVSKGLLIGDIRYKYSPSDENTVISTDPPPDSILSKGEKVSLVLSKGPARFLMPDLCGLSLQEAKDRVTRLELEAGEITYTTNSPLCNKVILQSPGAGEEVRQGDVVNLILGE